MSDKNVMSIDTQSQWGMGRDLYAKQNLIVNNN